MIIVIILTIWIIKYEKKQIFDIILFKFLNFYTFASKIQ